MCLDTVELLLRLRLITDSTNDFQLKSRSLKYTLHRLSVLRVGVEYAAEGLVTFDQGLDRVFQLRHVKCA